MICNNSKCKKETTNPKFCSRSCSAVVNNKLYHKRKVESTCDRCKNPCTTTRRFCRSCWSIIVTERSIFRWENALIKELKAGGNANNSRYTYIRELARKNFYSDSNIKACFICGYDKHIEVCHIKPIKSFSDDTKVSEINHINNLIGLCRNHHWELDHNLLDEHTKKQLFDHLECNYFIF